jgi:prolyl oligopeptidase
MRALRRLIWPLPALLAVIAAAPASAVAAATSGDATPAAIDATPPDNGLHYPLTRRQDLVEDHFGVKVTDPYRLGRPRK